MAADDLLSLLFRLAFTGAARRLQLTVKSPGYDAEVADNVPYLDIAGVHDEAGGALTFFAVNRHGGETIDLDVDLHGFGAARIAIIR